MPSLTVVASLCAFALPALADVYPVTVPSGFFPGANSGIGSWYRANNAGDNTSGRSWCGFDYYNSDPLFAVVSLNPLVSYCIEFLRTNLIVVAK